VSKTEQNIYARIRALWPVAVAVTAFGLSYTYTGWAQKRGHRLVTIVLSNLNRFTIFFTGRFLGKFAIKCILKIPAHLAYVATLPCGTLMSAKEAINDKLQGSVATYLRCGWLVNQIKVYC